MAEFDVKGLKELEKTLLKMPAKLGQKVLKQAGRVAMKPVLQVAQNNISVDSGDAKSSLAISAKNGKGKTAAQIHVGAFRKKATKKQGGKTFSGVNQKILALEFGTSRQKPDPFLARALESNAQNVLTIFTRQLKIKIDKAWK